MVALRHSPSQWSLFRSAPSNSNPSATSSSGPSPRNQSRNVDIPAVPTVPIQVTQERRSSRIPSRFKLKHSSTAPISKEKSPASCDNPFLTENQRQKRPGFLKKAKSHSLLRVPRATSSHSSKSVDQKPSALGCKPPTTAAPKNTLPDCLSKLPNEIWRIIASHLTPASKACLALSCHYLARNLASSAFKEVNTCSCKPEKLEFLKNLHPRLPDHVLCPKCATFHPHGKKKQYKSTSNNLHDSVSSQFTSKDCVRLAAKAYLFGTYELEWWQVQMIMRAQLISPQYGLQAQALNLESNKPHGQWYTSCEGAVVGGHLLVKVHSVRPYKFGTSNQEARVEESFPSCSHLNEKTTLTKACQQVLSSGNEPYAGNSSFQRESTLYRCEWCPSEYQAELRSAASDDSRAAIMAKKKECQFLLCVSRWIDAGEGLSPDNDEWFALTTVRKHCGKGAAYKGSPYDIGDLPAIKCRYEGCGSTSESVPVVSICNSAGSQ